MRIIAFYLPQFHNIPENDEWWGDGFTEWVNVKKAEPIYEGHEQPRVPLDGNYYNLLDDDVKIWQAELAKKYGIYGFCYYHYWFNGKLLLEKPMEQMLENKKVDLPFCVCWANEPWTRAWVGEKKVLIGQEYGTEKEWKEHFDYMLPFFRDDRYIKEDNRPLYVIYRPEIIPCLQEMLALWDKLAKENGFDGMCFAYQNIDFDLLKDKDDSMFTYNIEFQPHYAFYDLNADRHKYLRAMKGPARTSSSSVTASWSITSLNMTTRGTRYSKGPRPQRKMFRAPLSVGITPRVTESPDAFMSAIRRKNSKNI